MTITVFTVRNIVGEFAKRYGEDAFKAQKEICADSAIVISTFTEYIIQSGEYAGEKSKSIGYIVDKQSIINAPTPFNNNI